MILGIPRQAVKLVTTLGFKEVQHRFFTSGCSRAAKPPKESSPHRSDDEIDRASNKLVAPRETASAISLDDSGDYLNLGEIQDNSTRPKEGRIVFSGIQPTGVPHLGNYIGALRQWKRYHEQSFDPRISSGYRAEQYFSIVDLHALTASMARADRLRLRQESYASLLAMGLRNTGTTAVFFQSDVSYHSELMWILSNVASTGYLSRMTQWKSKLNLPLETSLLGDDATAVLKLGLFSYPVLQAADILLYGTTLVPVGHDQLQHIEFTRTLARGFNAYLTETSAQPVFTLPTAVVVPGKRIMSLRKPTQKMSKSDPDPKSRILITDSPDEIRQKINGATTDSIIGISYDRETRPGVSNLIEIYKHTTEITESCDVIAQDCQNISMKALKDMVATAITKELGSIRPAFLQLMDQNDKTIADEIHSGATKARQKASEIFSRVQESLGFV